tara:strand:- start:6 stop:620 length:615 start_codon:yes stop_codon:yes gene_type:complete
MKYKLFKFNESYAIQRISDNVSFLIDLRNRDYFQFVEDIYEQGIGIVEGADIQTEIPYVDARVAEYPPIGDQLDKIYHSGVNAWKADIKVIKDKYPKTQVGITTTESLPSWLNEALFNKQKEKYIEAKERLERYELSVGVIDESKDSEFDPISRTYIIEPLPIAVEKDGETIRNPLVVQDEQERMAAQQVINQTPQAVIDSINT